MGAGRMTLVEVNDGAYGHAKLRLHAADRLDALPIDCLLYTSDAADE